ncbi:MAG: substrate-binding domain-containing protein, partial [Christensenella sp.]|uniref:substrate-binding domain-containing protein n=1 Tax=Christensenella sp. TaxID=1935934 RepID=UPI002B21B66C
NKVPIVFVNNYYQDFACTCVLLDDRKWMHEITNLLIGAGHKKIAGYFKFDDQQGHWRYAGYVDALMEAGIEIDENYVGWYDSSNTTRTPQKMDMLEEDFVSAIDPCTALVCYNDFVAKRLIHKLNKRGRTVPDDISVAGFDNSVDAKINGNDLTSVNHPKEQVGVEAAKRLLALIRNPEEIREERVCCYMSSFIRERSSIKKISE